MGSKSDVEVFLMLLITGVTNFAMIPAIMLLYRQRRPFQAFVGSFTMMTSFMYHCCDSIDGSLWLSEGQWHRLDNIGSIMSFITWMIYLMDIRSAVTQRYANYFALSLVLILQEKAPWNEWFTFGPILFTLGALLMSFGIRGQIPRYDMKYLNRGLVLLGVGALCFVRGLNEKTDPCRLFHGLWHASIGASAYYNWMVLTTTTDQVDELPTKRVF